MMEMEMEMEMAVSKTFELEKAVCNHGFFMMAPNTWIPSTKTLVRPLRLPDNSSVTVYISQSRPNFITITATCRDVHQHIIMDQVRRMLRLSKEEDEAIKEFHSLHAEAANKGFGRLFRNPTLFEDIVKTWLLCACRFKDSLEMAETLCTQQKRKRGMRKRECKFPTPQEVCTFDRNKLKKRLGYRGDRILDLALDVTSGKINLERFDSYSNGDDLYTELKKIKGVGDFVSCNILMCMGFYHRVPVDSETIRHINQVHKCVDKNTDAIMKNIYDKYAPFQTLAYWYELLEYYESKFGKLSLLEKGEYKNVTGSKFIE